MPTASEFRRIRCQASLFTPGIQFKAGRAMAYLLGKCADLDVEPLSLPQIAGLPPELPQVVIKTSDGSKVLQAGPSRIDIIHEADPIADPAAFLRWASEILLGYLRSTSTIAGRIAYVSNAVVDVVDPAIVLSRHFCQKHWWSEPLDRPSAFELHALKKYHLPNLFEVNSWMRCKTVETAGTSGNALAIVAEQDLNSLAEATDTLNLTPGQIQDFFLVAPEEMNSILSLYFPRDPGNA